MNTYATIQNGVVVDIYRSPESMAEDHIDVTDAFPPVVRGCLYDGAVFDDSALPDDSKKRRGVPFEGVMCSATADDQNGVTAVLTSWQINKTGYAGTLFQFSNGAVLQITKNNIQDFAAVWLPFRQQFFKG